MNVCCECEWHIRVKRKHAHLIEHVLGDRLNDIFLPLTSVLPFEQTCQSDTGLGTEIALLVPPQDRIAFRTKHCLLISIDPACGQIALLPGRSPDKLLKKPF